jgi:hypothetical protein
VPARHSGTGFEHEHRTPSNRRPTGGLGLELEPQLELEPPPPQGGAARKSGNVTCHLRVYIWAMRGKQIHIAAHRPELGLECIKSRREVCARTRTRRAR